MRRSSPSTLAPRRDVRSIAVSVAVHVVVGALVLQVTLGTERVSRFFRDAPRSRPQAERLTYVPLPRGDSTRAQVDGGDGRVAVARVRTARPLQAPVEIPGAVPPAVPRPEQPAPEPGGSGPLVGGGGPLRGVQPSYGDPRVWTGAPELITAPKTEDQRRDSVLAARLGRYRDSMAVVAASSEKPGPPSWVMEKNGQKYGVDEKFIHLGKFSLPTALLAALPFNKEGRGFNPIEAERQRRQAFMSAEIAQQSQRRLNEDEFRKAVKAIRERKERERREAAQQKKAADGAPVAAGTR